MPARKMEPQAGQLSDVNKFLKLKDRYLDIPKFDAAILKELVRKIVVYSPVKKAGANRPVFSLCRTNPHSFEDCKSALK